MNVRADVVSAKINSCYSFKYTTPVNNIAVEDADRRHI